MLTTATGAPPVLVGCYRCHCQVQLCHVPCPPARCGHAHAYLPGVVAAMRLHARSCGGGPAVTDCGDGAPV